MARRTVVAATPNSCTIASWVGIRWSVANSLARIRSRSHRNLPVRRHGTVVDDLHLT